MTTPHVDPTRFAQAMVEVVENLGWDKRIKSNRALALKAGMTHTYLNARMTGGTPFNVGDVAALANAFEVRPDFIFDAALEIALSDPGDELPAVADNSDIEGPGEDSI